VPDQTNLSYVLLGSRTVPSRLKAVSTYSKYGSQIKVADSEAIKWNFYQIIVYYARRVSENNGVITLHDASTLALSAFKKTDGAEAVASRV
jgi:hypothetical protein